MQRDLIPAQVQAVQLAATVADIAVNVAHARYETAPCIYTECALADVRKARAALAVIERDLLGVPEVSDRLCRECDHAEEADDRRRDNPLEPDFRRLGQ